MENFTDYKFRPSSLGKLMTNGRSKSDPLGETCKAFLRDIFIEVKYDRTKDITNKFMEKGTMVEEDSLDLITKHYGELYIKNKKKYSNDLIAGTPDIILKEKIIDIKSSWDIWTFAGADGSNKDYYWQLQGYMLLTGRKHADLVYCLNDSPDPFIYDEFRKTCWKRGIIDLESQEAAELEAYIRFQMTYSDITPAERIKVFNFEYNEEDIAKLEEKVKIAREYLATLSL